VVTTVSPYLKDLSGCSGVLLSSPFFHSLLSLDSSASEISISKVGSSAWSKIAGQGFGAHGGG